MRTYEGCSVLIFEIDSDRELGTDVVNVYNSGSQYIELQNLSVTGEIPEDTHCRLLILQAPVPMEYRAKVVKDGTSFLFMLYKGMEKENRMTPRYGVDTQAQIEHFVCSEGKLHYLCEPIPVSVINVSQGGVRIMARPEMVSIGDRFQFNLQLSGGKKILYAQVVNSLDKGGDVTEYGCRLITLNGGDIDA